MSKQLVMLGSIVVPKGLQTGPFGSQLKANEYTETGIPVVMPKDIYCGEIITDEIARVPEEKARKLAKHRIVPGDIIFPRRGDLGRIGVAKKENKGWLCGTGCLRARLKDEVDINYIHQYVQLTSVNKWLERNALGQTMLNLNTEIISNLPVYLAPLPEQTAIADLLSTWDTAIEKTERLIAAKQQQRASLMQQLLPGKRRFPGLSTPWREVRLGDIFKRITRKNNAGIDRVLTASGEHGLIDQKDYFNKSVSGESLHGYYHMKQGEFAYNRSAMNGYPYGAIKRLDDYSEGVLSTLYLCFSISSKELCSDFIMHYFEAGMLNRQLRKIAQVGSRAHGLLNVTAGDFFDVKLQIPESDEQEKIALFLNGSNSEISLLQKQLDSFKEQKKGLMQQLLTGKARVKIAKKDVA
jgi:type I restriction enzyme S subunit